MTSPPQPTPPSAPSPSALSIVALALGFASWVAFGLTASIPGVIVAKIELGRVDRGESPEPSRAFAQIGFWVSLVNVVFVTCLLVGVCVLFAFFGWAFWDTNPNGYPPAFGPG